MVRSAGAPMRCTIAAASAMRVDEVGLRPRQRLDAVEDAGGGGIGGNCRPHRLGAGGSGGGVVLVADAALRRRAVHEIVAAELGAKLDQPAQDLERAFAHRVIGAGDRQAGRRHQQPVQAAHRDAGVLRGTAQLRALRRRHAIGLLAERERRQFEPAIAELGRQRALAGELELAQHLVAQGKLHRQMGFVDLARWVIEPDVSGMAPMFAMDGMGSCRMG